MKAAAYDRYGPPDVVEVKEVEKPSPKDGEVLIRIHAATVTAADMAARKGSPFAARLAFGLTKPKMRTLGTEFAGVIEAVGVGGDPVQGGRSGFRRQWRLLRCAR